MIPCQDSPSVKITYSASVKSPLPVVMSALRTGVEEDDEGIKIYHFRQETTVPSYLIAIAVGNLVGREIGPRSTVWSEPEMVDDAAWEFAVRILPKIYKHNILIDYYTHIIRILKLL